MMKSTELLVELALVLFFSARSCGWKAIPANQASYAMRALLRANNFAPDEEPTSFGSSSSGIPDELLPRLMMHSNYKFGYCTPDSTIHQYLYKTVNMTFSAYQDTKLSFLYLLEHKNTAVHSTCLMMKIYSSRKYLFKKSRFPLYYCRGHVYLVMMNTIQRIAIHEFYIVQLMLLPVNFKFEFYRAPRA